MKCLGVICIFSTWLLLVYTSVWSEKKDWETQFMDGQLLASDNSILCGREHMNLGGSQTISISVPLLGWLCYLSILSIPSSPHPPSLSGSFLVLHVSSLEILYSSHMNEERFTYIGLFWTYGLYVSLLYDVFINV